MLGSPFPTTNEWAPCTAVKIVAITQSLDKSKIDIVHKCNIFGCFNFVHTTNVCDPCKAMLINCHYFKISLKTECQTSITNLFTPFMRKYSRG